MKHPYRTLVALIAFSLPVVAFAWQPSEHTTWYGSDAPLGTMEYATRQANIATIADCLHENPYNKSNCVGVTKSYCHSEQPTCNLQEAAAWNSFASRKPSTQAAWLRHDQQACAYHARTDFTINQPDAWAPNLAPSGCVLQRSAHRFLQMTTRKHVKKHVRHRKVAASTAPEPMAPMPMAPAAMAPVPLAPAPAPVPIMPAPAPAAMAPAPMAPAPVAAAPAPVHPAPPSPAAPVSMAPPAAPLPVAAPAPLMAPAPSATAMPALPSPAAAPVPPSPAH